MHDILLTIGKAFITSAIAVSAFVGGLFGQEQQLAPVGATIPVAVATFQTSLQASISDSATSMTLVSGTDKAGNALDGYICFNVDEGTATEEFMCGTTAGTAVSSMIRGLDPVDGDTEVTALKKAHRRGASVKVTNYPSLAILSRILNGNEVLPNPITYEVGVEPLSDGDLTDKGYVDGLAFAGAGVIDATELARGVVELATQVEMSSSTSAGSSGTLVLQSKYATSTAPLSGRYVTVTGPDGNLDDDFIPATISQATTFSSTLSAGTTTINGSLTLSGNSAVSNIASSSIVTYVASTTPSVNWTKPLNLKYVLVKVVGGGGGGGGGTTDAGETSAGGGGGGYCERIIPADAIGSTVTITVGGGGTGGSAGGGGTGGTGNTGGPSSFGSFCTATGGVGGGGGGNDNNPAGPAGGTGSSGDINIPGGYGGDGIGSGATSPVKGRGGFGGRSMMSNSSGNGNGTAGTVYGGGGSGRSAGSDGVGGDGAVGAVFIYQVFF